MNSSDSKETFDMFHEKFKLPLMFVHICDQIANFDVKIFQK